MHSFRAYFTCALLASGHSPHEVQALVRWCSVKSVHVYQTLTPQQYTSHVARASATNIDATTVHALWAQRPVVDADEHVAALRDAADQVGSEPQPG